ncbi:hypothetical protein SODALDRAFT_330564 [Sodiomyces alkalinus F11]|uniref:Uncharacterized protein n=1 Tax=Sodiomyces alkalinus (strain CBS 110278 / VKM F-3762 / F11) TaxID=1314773 RepID=A0A3N2Q2J0_SODAK|nr:hypothetical protein SODALDRAFT_330564 [Sodiomyces alkalinus F11]ROT40835.1 hypothetical protein SODALDRAFT_330564 [Sodiomyces alkalinus F11]
MYWLGMVVKASSALGAAIALPLRLVWSLGSSLVAFILILLAPAIYMFSYSFGWITTLINFCISPVQPLYIFITCGAIVGGLAGVVVSFTSEVVTSALGLHDRAKEEDYDESIAPTPITMLTPRPTSSRTEDSSPPETDWHFLETMAPKRRERTAGLVSLSQTIHEEESNGSEL